ncbi:MAG: heparinase II/III family protein [Hydrogenophaga sp.]|nr:heparinase II/III family protein [Hydrogenophaga sp.]
MSYGMTPFGIDGVPYPMSKPVRTDSSGGWLAGRINRTNLKESQRIWQLIGPDYVPIDWQLDFKSGYRWREDVWHRDISLGHLPGVDIKVPWELGRMQHLPTLALACHFARAEAPGFRDATAYAQEFCSQVLDFIATNPPGFGVNWSCAMDVAIRCANLLVARDIVIASGAHLDEAFERAFTASIFAHARHVMKNLEWSPVYRGNHYLANIVGLLFAASCLPGDEEVDSWLAFSVQELVAEVEYQFHEDGSNFEASVCYHRLSAEMVLWGCALLANLPADKLSVLTQPQLHDLKKLPRLAQKSWPLHPVPNSDRASPVPPWCWARLGKMADFTQAMTRPDGTVVQFGDNDSGRFVVLGSGEQLRAANDTSAVGWSLDHRALIASIRALLGESSSLTEIDDPGARLVRGFSGLGDIDRRHPNHGASHATVGDEGTWGECIAKYDQAPATGRWAGGFAALSHDLLNGVQYNAFSGMGCYVFRSEQLFLAIRCGEIGVAGLGPHAHCDQLAIELVIGGEDCARDPGTYLYTPFPQKRNAYRSAKAHHVPHVSGREPANLALGLFDLRGAAKGECLYFGPRGFVGRHAGYGSWVYRIIALESTRVTIRDFAEGGLALTSSSPERLPFSPAYGRTLG